MITCPSCGHKNNPWAKFCVKCTNTLTSKPKDTNNEIIGYRCPTCKTITYGNHTHCICGHWLLDSKFPAEPVTRNEYVKGYWKNGNSSRLHEDIKPFSLIIKSFISIFIILLVMGLLFNILTYQPKNKVINSEQSTNQGSGALSVSTHNSTSSFISKPMSNNTAAALNQINQIHQDIKIAMGPISEQHKIPVQNRNIVSYRDTLINGINTCEQSGKELSSMNPPGELVELCDLTKEYVSNLDLALKYYLNAIDARDNSQINHGNNFLNTSNQNLNTYRTKFIEFLQQNNYKYELLSDGSIRYWFEDSAYNNYMRP